MENYDVFLNVRGCNVKGGFIVHLDEALRYAGLKPFLEIRSLVKDNYANFRSIEHALSVAKVHVAVVTKGYAESKQCLSELIAMMRSQKPVVPVFYGVEPIDLSWVDSGSFAAAFKKHKSKERAQQVEEWIDALRKLADIAGFYLSNFNGDEAELKRKVVDVVFNLTHAKPIGALEYYDVFLNYRRLDLQAGFITHLDEALRLAGLNPFFYVKSFGLGDRFPRSTIDALKVAKVHVVVVSRRYAESKFCLNELATMMRIGKPVVPVYYDVEHTDLYQVESGLFATAFEKHKSIESAEQVEEWIDALRKLTKISGFHLSDYMRNEVELKRHVVEAILKLASRYETLQVEQYPLDLQGSMNTCIHELEEMCGVIDSSCIGCDYEDLVETLELFLKATEECMKGMQNIPSYKFNNEQCKYLVDKLKVVVQSARLFTPMSNIKHQGSYSFTNMAGCVEIFKLMLALAKQIESIVEGCCKDTWIQAAMTLTNVSEYVSFIGFNLELLRIVFTNEHATIGSLTLNMVDDINKVEVENVQTKASMDVENLFEKVLLELNSLSDKNRDLATYLLQRLKRIKMIPTSVLVGSFSWSIIEEGGVFGKLFKKLQEIVRLGKSISGAIVDKAMWFGTPVAIKTFYGQKHLGFMQEVEILAGLCHPHITSMFCSGIDHRKCSIVMELMDEDLYDLMQRKLDANNNRPPFNILEAVDIMLQVGEGVNYLHNKKIEHRDLKSMNILVKSVKGSELKFGYVHAKVADFGLSKMRESSIGFSNQTYNTGTNRWMAPEIINLDHLSDLASTLSTRKEPKFSFKCDVYSFAMVCYEILTGEVPFSNISNSIVVKKEVMKGSRPNLPQNCPDRLKILIKKCWNQEPKERPSFTSICSELKYLKYLLMICFIQGPLLPVVESLQLQQKTCHCKLRKSDNPSFIDSSGNVEGRNS